jgi:hypothetical protein
MASGKPGAVHNRRLLSSILALDSYRSWPGAIEDGGASFHFAEMKKPGCGT